MKRIIFSGSLLLALGLVLWSCKKDEPDPEPPKETTVDEDKANLRTEMDKVNTCVGTFVNGDGMDAMVDFMGMSQGDALQEDWVEALADSFDIVALVDTTGLEDGNFNFSANTGTYSYNFSTKQWGKTSTPTDKIVLEFPASSTSSTNNAVMTITGYSAEIVTIDDDDIWLPNASAASLTIDGTKVFGWDFSISHGDPIPTSVSVAIDVEPFSYTLSYTKLSDSKFEGSLGFGASGCDYEVSATVEMLDGDYENWGDDSFKSISATLTMNDMELDGVLDLEELNPIEDPTVSQVNAAFDCAVNVAGQKVGDLLFIEDSQGDTHLYIAYKDDTEENTNTYYDDLADDLELTLAPIFGDVDINDN